jgi:prevent-host-death family protein
MKQVRIGEFKAKFNELLRAVRRGRSIVVLDRNIVIAQIVPIRDRPVLRIRKPVLGSPAPNKVSVAKLGKFKMDVLKMLLEERQRHQ